MTSLYLRTPEAAGYLGVSQSTLHRKRRDGTGPKFRVLGERMVSYAISDLDAWANQKVLSSTSERQVA